MSLEKRCHCFPESLKTGRPHYTANTSEFFKQVPGGVPYIYIYMNHQDHVYYDLSYYDLYIYIYSLLGVPI